MVLKRMPRKKLEVGSGLFLIATIHQDGISGLCSGQIAPLIEAATGVFAGGGARFDFYDQSARLIVSTTAN